MAERRSGRRSYGIGTLVARNLRFGAAVGLGAYLLGYLVTFLFTSVDGVESGEVAGWKLAGMVFYGAHTVDAEFTATVEGNTSTETFDLFGASGPENLASTVPELLYFLVPVAVVLGAGYLVYASTDRQVTVGAAGAIGATTAVGYLVGAVLGTVLFEASSSSEFLGVSGSQTLGPELAPAILLVGVLYPLVGGAVGGALGRLVS